MKIPLLNMRPRTLPTRPIVSLINSILPFCPDLLLSAVRCSLSIATAFRFDSIVVRNFIYYSLQKCLSSFHRLAASRSGTCARTMETLKMKRNRIATVKTSTILYSISNAFRFDSSFVGDVPLSSKCWAHLLPNKECIRHKEMTIEL